MGLGPSCVDSVLHFLNMRLIIFMLDNGDLMMMDGFMCIYMNTMRGLMWMGEGDEGSICN